MGASNDKASGRVNSIMGALRFAYRRHYLRKEIRSMGSFKSALTRDQRAKAKAYWGKYTKHYSPLWHELIAARTGNFDVHYIPADVMFTDIEGYLNDWASAHGLDNKNNYTMYFPEVRHPKTAFKKMHGLFHDADFNIISKERAIQNCIEMGDVIFKLAIESGKGLGISFWRSTDGEAALRQLVDGLCDDVNAQEFIKQHPALASINPVSVNTIRVMTLASASGVSLVAAYLQLGSGESRIDQTAMGGTDISIRTNGQLAKYGVRGDYFRTTEHPNGLVYEGFEVPGYHKVVDMAIALHKKIGNFRIISWDFAVGENGEPIFIEMNLKYGGIMFHQISSGPLFGDRTDELLDEVFGKK